ncbi:hypothetical protein CALVIDRAFT_278562 [Calocera viscosa TUFC12733]|uniref:Uncharacterized protein n=1 Tax=Calocera viscosa (strain TUFC12733) TaxID=1330018 RepID=A0A167R318_CALVF|nr:hypothetical protein CALVIDRAFT_278562 [Calocera viscosa TUFC12733]
MPHLAEPLIPSLTRILHLERSRSPSSDLTDGKGVAPFLPIPSVDNLYAFLLDAVQPESNSAHRYSEVGYSSANKYSEVGYYDHSLRTWARSELDKAIRDPSEAIPNLILVLLPSLAPTSERYELDSDVSHDGIRAPQGLSASATLIVICGLLALRQACLSGRPQRFSETRQHLWTTWIKAFLTSDVPPIVQFSILLSFLQLAEFPEDASYLLEVLSWLFDHRRTLRFADDRVEAAMWQTELSVVGLKALLCAADPNPSQMYRSLRLIWSLFPNCPLQEDLILNRVVATLLPDNIRLAVGVLQCAKVAEVDIWPATATRIFYNALSDGNLDITHGILQPAWLQDDDQKLHLRNWITNATRDTDIHIAQHQRSVFGHALARALRSKVKFDYRTWRRALLILMRSGHLKWPVSLAERIEKRLRDGRLEGKLEQYIPRRLYRNVPLSHSKVLIKRLEKLLETMPALWRIPTKSDAKPSPAVVLATELRRPMVQRIRQPNRPLIHNLVLTKLLRVASRTGSRLHTTRLARAMLVRVSWGQAVVDPITTNLLLQSVLRWDRSISIPAMKTLFDRIFVLGYPGSERYPDGLFGTFSNSKIKPQPPGRSVHPARHARPLYKIFIRAFARAGDWMSAKKLVGLLIVAKEAEIARKRAYERERRSGATYRARTRERLLRAIPRGTDPKIWEGLTNKQIRDRIAQGSFYFTAFQDDVFYSIG